MSQLKLLRLYRAMLPSSVNSHKLYYRKVESPMTPANISINICIPFNNIGIVQQAHTLEWINYRMSLFMNYTLKSLLKQTDQDFQAYVLYSSYTEELVHSALKDYPPLPSNVHFIPGPDYIKYISNNIQGTDFYYEVSLHSDDMYHENFIDYISQYDPQADTEVLLCQNGYLYYSPTHRLIPYFNFSSSFNCFIYPTADFLNGKRYKLVGYMSAIKLKHEILPYPWYINHAHSKNVAFSMDIEVRRICSPKVWEPQPANVLALIGNEISDSDQIDEILSHYF